MAARLRRLRRVSPGPTSRFLLARLWVIYVVLVQFYAVFVLSPLQLYLSKWLSSDGEVVGDLQVRSGGAMEISEMVEL